VKAALGTAALMVLDLEEVAREWEGLSDGERASWSLDWGNEMSGLERAALEAAARTLIPIPHDHAAISRGAGSVRAASSIHCHPQSERTRSGSASHSANTPWTAATFASRVV
jgi:hypothetical protein